MSYAPVHCIICKAPMENYDPAGNPRIDPLRIAIVVGMAAYLVGFWVGASVWIYSMGAGQ